VGNDVDVAVAGVCDYDNNVDIGALMMFTMLARILTMRWMMTMTIASTAIQDTAEESNGGDSDYEDTDCDFEDG
jgi:hypothetical protein